MAMVPFERIIHSEHTQQVQRVHKGKVSTTAEHEVLFLHLFCYTKNNYDLIRAIKIYAWEHSSSKAPEKPLNFQVVSTVFIYCCARLPFLGLLEVFWFAGHLHCGFCILRIYLKVCF